VAQAKGLTLAVVDMCEHLDFTEDRTLAYRADPCAIRQRPLHINLCGAIKNNVDLTRELALLDHKVVHFESNVPLRFASCTQPSFQTEQQ
jgi:hypothetical protein